MAQVADVFKPDRAEDVVRSADDEEGRSKKECNHFWKQAHNYTEATSVHGFKYTLEKERTLFERYYTYFNQRRKGTSTSR